LTSSVASSVTPSGRLFWQALTASPFRTDLSEISLACNFRCTRMHRATFGTGHGAEPHEPRHAETPKASICSVHFRAIDGAFKCISLSVPASYA
jgi:hypothetical protein